MNKTIPVFALAVGLATLSVPAFAHDYDDENRRPSWSHIERDRDQVRADARKVEEEREELAEARRQQRRSWWNGDYWGTNRAAARIREEQAELRNAHQRLDREVADVRHDTFRVYPDYEPNRYGWWRHHAWWGYNRNRDDY